MASLAVGTGANAAVYSAVDALMFRAPRAIANPARLVDLYTSEGNGGTFGPFSHPDFVSAGAAASLEATAAIEQRAFETTQRPMIYFPMSRATSRGFYAVFRSHSGAETQMDRDVTATLTDLGGPTKLEVLPFETFVSQALAADRLIGTLIGACGGMALAWR